MPVFRFLAATFALLAVIVLVSDVSSPASKSILVPLSDHWQRLSPKSWAAANDAASQSRAPFLWTFGVLPLLNLPTTILLAIAAVLCGYVGRRRDKVNVFTN